MSLIIDLPTFLVDRPGLVAELQAASRHRFSLVVAPPGFGKTTLLRQWAIDPATEDRVALLRLDRRDDDGRRLAGRLVEALGHLDPGVGASALERADRSGVALGDEFLAHLLEELELTGPGVLVVDELDSVTNPRLLLDLRALFHRLPPDLRVVAAMRFEPPSGWDEAPGRRLGHAELAFDQEDAALLLHRLSGQDLTEAQVASVLARTEGWPTALQLVGLALRDGADADAFVDRLDGADEFIGAYLTAEVLARQPSDVRRFLLHTSVLHRLSGPLCDVVTGRTDGHERLAEVDRQSMFLVPIDGDRTWFRYHRLFQDLTRRELRIEAPGREAQLLRAASAWHLEEGDVDAAVGYLLEARDWDEVLDLVLEHGRRQFEIGNAADVLRWIEQVPMAARADRRDIALTEAMLHTMVGTTVQGQEVVERLERTSTPTEGEQAVIDMMRAIWVQYHLPPASAIAAADAVLRRLEHLTEQDVPDLLGLTTLDHLRFIVSVSGARARWYQGHVERAQAELAALVDADFPYPPWQVNTLGALALVDTCAGSLRDGDGSAARALVIASREGLLGHASTGNALLAMGAIQRERGHLGRAELFLDQALAVAVRVRRSVDLGLHAAERAAVDLAAGAPTRGLERIQSYLASGQQRLPPLLADRLRAVEGRLRLAADDVEGARRSISTGAGPLSGLAVGTAVQVAARAGRPDDARQALDTWPLGTGPLSAERRLWTAVVADLSGEVEVATNAMAEAVALGEADGHVRLFLDAGPQADALLRGLRRSHPTPYLVRLGDGGAAPTAEAGADVLSPRELVILRYLPSHLSNAELADRLFVSQNTVKTHLRSIYRRLGVSGRRDAVAAAERLGLL